MRRVLILIFTLAPVIVSLPSCDQGDTPVSSSPDAGPPLVIINGILIDGTGSDPIPDAVILIEGG
ncbi:MAG: hypothetical protein KAJ12_08145, partial [Bacteroidetes bacterium]|nr:hypothetical protein [Bacteroidota bacterium]